jgi:hypothetical protein
MLRIFYTEKIQRLRPGLNPRTRDPDASMLTTRPPKPLSAYLKSRRCFSTKCYGLLLVCYWTVAPPYGWLICAVWNNQSNWPSTEDVTQRSVVGIYDYIAMAEQSGGRALC